MADARPRIREISRERLSVLNRGEAAATNLAECLAVDQSALVRAVLDGLERLPGEERERIVAAADAHQGSGISRKVAAIGRAFAEASTRSEDVRRLLVRLAAHPSDTARSWAAFATAGLHEGGPIAAALAAARPFAADGHFGVREWAWLAVRPAIAADIAAALAVLTAWTGDPDANVRRFAVESTRPRGVWCAHIPRLKERPEVAEGLLEPLRADPSVYVQDSVSNWLNDASKTRADWVRSLCARWTAQSPSAATARITRRALRTLRAA